MSLMPPEGLAEMEQKIDDIIERVNAIPVRKMTMRIVVRPASDNRDEQLVGHFVGIDGNPEVLAKVLTDEEYEAQFQHRDWYGLHDHDDLDRAIAAKLAALRHDERMAGIYAERVKAGRERILAMCNYYSDLVPAPVPDSKGHTPSSKRTKGKYSDLLYVNNPNRAAEITLVDKDAAIAAGLVRGVQVIVDKPLPMAELRAKLEKQGNLPGFSVEMPDPVSINLKDKE